MIGKEVDAQKYDFRDFFKKKLLSDASNSVWRANTNFLTI